MPSFPNLLKSRKGRLATFFLLYVCEGLPQGFTTGAVALEFKRMGMSAMATGTFLAFIMLPWTWKWIAGPVIDNFHLRRFGQRKQWIVLAQCGMLATLCAALLAFPAESGKIAGFFTVILLAHNIFAACQDVAIDSLACATLHEHERGLANGLMFAGAQAGSALGGSGVIFLKSYFGFSNAALLVPLCILGILGFVVLLIADAKAPEIPPEDRAPSPFVKTMAEIGKYLAELCRVFFATRRGFLGMVLAVLPFGGMALGMSISKTITPMIGMTDGQIAKLDLVTALVFIVSCVCGGYFSDRFGRKITLTLFSLGTLLPTLWIGWKFQEAGYIHPAASDGTGNWPVHEMLIRAWWLASIAWSVFNGLLYGIRTAFYMDIVEPKVATTQFTAGMALMNLVLAYTLWWQGKALTPADTGGWGFTYFQMFQLDALLGALFIFVIPFIRIPHRLPQAPPATLPAETEIPSPQA